MAQATSGLSPAVGTQLQSLPFSSVEHLHHLVASIERHTNTISTDGQREPPKLLPPLVALQAAVEAAPTLAVHLVTPLGPVRLVHAHTKTTNTTTTALCLPVRVYLCL